MFFPRTQPLELDLAAMLGLRLSLNTPSVSTEELAGGPARGAILVHRDASGATAVTIGMRSLRTGELVLYGSEERIHDRDSMALAVDAALSFAETMGFLFDDDEVDPDDPASQERALGLWFELMGRGKGSRLAGSRRVAPRAPSTRSDELWLDDLAESPAPPKQRPAAGPTRRSAGASASRPAAPARPARQPAPGSAPKAAPRPVPGPPPKAAPKPVPGPVPKAAPKPAAGSAPKAAPKPAAGSAPKAAPKPAPIREKTQPGTAALGRLRLVKRRAPSSEGSGRPQRANPILRLFTAF